jgi:AcrR family transcriptional regulator
VPAGTTRDALMEQGALLFARRGVGGVSVRELHEAVGARNESALHYHFGGRAGLAREIVRTHLAEVEQRRSVHVARIAAKARSGDVRTLVHALLAPLADDLATPVGRAHLRLVAQLNEPTLAFRRGGFEADDTNARAAVVRWLHDALSSLPAAIRAERLAALHGQLVALLGLRAQLIDESPKVARRTSTELFVANLLDMLVAGLGAAPSAEARAASRETPSRRRRQPVAANDRH